jgi:hypothetical protein
MINRIRQFHRWMAVLFTLAVVANFVAIGMGKQIMWLYYVPLAPLGLLMLSGLIMFVQYYFSRWRSGARTGV